MEISAPDLDTIARECLGPEVIAGIKDQLDFPGPPIRSAEAPEHLLMILFASRAGSTYAGQLLSRTPHFNRVGEAFNLRQLRLIRERHDLIDDGEALRWMMANFGSPRAFAAKCGVPGLAGALVTGFLEATFPRLQFLLLDRRDRIAQAVSLYRADLTGRFQSSQQASRTIAADDYDREQIAARLASIKRVYGKFDHFLHRTGKRREIVWYEDIVADPAGFVDKVCDRMALARPAQFDAAVRATKLADDISEAWIARFRGGR